MYAIRHIPGAENHWGEGVSTIGGGGGDTTIPSPWMAPKQPTPEIELHEIPCMIGKLAPN